MSSPLESEMEKTRDLRDYLRTWLDRHQKANNVAPVIREVLEETEWELGVLRDRPPDATSIPIAEVDEQAGLALDRISVLLPQMPEYSSTLAFQIGSISTNSTSAAFTYVQQVAALGTPATASYAVSKAEDYRRLQEAHERKARVKALIEEVMPVTLERFENARKAVDQSRMGTGSKSAAASELRNLIDGIQGELYEKARHVPRENMTWKTMAERLVPGSGCAVLVDQERVRACLYSDLSQAAKLREGQVHQQIEDLWTRTLDHVYSVLSSVKAGVSNRKD